MERTSTCMSWTGRRSTCSRRSEVAATGRDSSTARTTWRSTPAAICSSPKRTKGSACKSSGISAWRKCPRLPEQRACEPDDLRLSELVHVRGDMIKVRLHGHELTPQERHGLPDFGAPQLDAREPLFEFYGLLKLMGVATG